MFPELTNYQPPEPSLWQGRQDSLPGERFFQHVQWVNLQSQELTGNQTVIVGLNSDEGVQRNLGRPGAKSGPNALREQFAKLACHNDRQFIDAGNIVCADNQLEQAQEQFAQLISHCHQLGHQTIAFGGGHEIAWPHFKGLIQHYPKLGIINVDAHFDLRPMLNQQSTSGTPFWQIKQYCDQLQVPFEYCCLGIQPVANTKMLFDRADQWGVSYLTAEQIHLKSFRQQTSFLDDFIAKQDYLYVTICLDAFAECYAPGVSAPQPMGLNPWDTLALLKYIKQTGKVVSLDIAELSPPLDQGQKTAKLAATLLAEWLD